MQNYESNTGENYPQPPFKKDVLPLALQNPTPDNPPWNSWIGILSWIASVLFIAVVPVIAIIVYLVATGVNLAEASNLPQLIQSDPNILLVNIIAIIPAHLITLGLAWIIVTNFNKFSFREVLGWEWGGFKYWHIGAILVGFFVLAHLLTSIFGEQPNEFLKLLQSSRTIVYFVAFMATFTAPVVEEVVYRGILYSAFQRSMGAPVAIFLTTALFALVHVPQYYPSVATIILICLLSLILTLIRAKTGNLLPCIILHTVFNGIQSLLLIFEPYLREVIKQNPEQSAFFFIF